jgi:hypothetical protein
LARDVVTVKEAGEQGGDDQHVLATAASRIVLSRDFARLHNKESGLPAMFRLMRIEPPEWAIQPSITITRVTIAEYAAMQRYRDRMLKAVHQEVEAYLNDPRLYFDGNADGFPQWSRLTGT